MFKAFGLSLEEFQSYIDECKAMGFTEDPGELDDFYQANNKDGYHIYTNYDSKSKSLSMIANAPEDNAETSGDGQTTSE